MTIALTIFGVGVPGKAAVFCYAFLRAVRGSGTYPPPTLPHGATRSRTTRSPLAGIDGVELTGWDYMLDEAQEQAVLDAFAQGRFSIPADCPIDPGRTLIGKPYEPSLVFEEGTWARVSGTGMLWMQGLVPEGVLEAVATTLNGTAGIGVAPAALSALVDAVAVQSDLQDLLKDRRWVGTVDRFWRAEPEGAHIGPLLNAIPEKLDFRTRKPARAVHIHRHASGLDRQFTLHIRLQNFDEILTDQVLKMASGEVQLSLEAPAHVTDVMLEAFNPDGTIAQKSLVVSGQGMNFGVVAQGRADLLPKVFSGAPASPDLETRPRVATVVSQGPSVGPRSGAFDLLRRNDQRIDTIIGPSRWSGECVWFDRGTDGQIEAIRWIKGKLEAPSVRQAYLVDPFLGSDALQRVIARQGNETIALTILVSPGSVNPDAEVPDTEAVEDHLQKLVTAANAWSALLCGKIAIFHIKRGEAARQAFHDRYLAWSIRMEFQRSTCCQTASAKRRAIGRSP